MAAGTLTMTCLLLVVGQVPPDVWPTNQRSFKIPIDIQPARRQEIRELILYVSLDQGRNWQQEAVVSAEKDSFLFYAAADGMYWFRVAAVNRQGKQEPENVYKGPPDQKVLIDTLKPTVRITSAQRQGDEIVAAWEIQEDYPDLANLKLDYRFADNPSAAWLPAAFTPTLNGQARIRMTSPSPVVLRLSIKDLAGNLSFAQADVPGSTGVAAATFTAENPATPAPNPAPVPAPEMKPTPPVEPAPREVSPVPPAPVTTPTPAPIPAPPGNTWVSNSVPPPVQTRPEPPLKLVASTGDSPSGSFQSGSPYPPPNKSLPSLQIVNSPQVILEYELAKVGPSGIGNVELYVTQDEGQTWRSVGQDPELESSMRGGRYQRTVELPGEGIYGFYLVVQSKAGLGKSLPRSGDVPEMRIEVDTTRPEAQLFAPVPDSQRRDALTISWTGKDRNLAPTPVTLEWSETREGPWHIIGANLANSGRHAWQLPQEGMPVSVYLRLRVRDVAGNEGVAITNEPQLVDLTEPVGRIVSVKVPPQHP